MVIKSAMKYHLMTIRMVVMTIKKQATVSAGENVKKRKPSYKLVGM